MLALPKDKVRWQSSDERFKSYPLQVSVYHPLTMHIYQPLSDVLELRGKSSGMLPSALDTKTHKLETIGISVDFEEFIDVPILHPLRCHCEQGKGIIHCYPQQW